MDKFRYLTCCVDSTAEAINAMVERAREITYETFRRYVDTRQVARQFGYDRDFPLKKDWAVRFYKSRYEGQECVYMEHSRIKYIFVP